MKTKFMNLLTVIGGLLLLSGMGLMAFTHKNNKVSKTEIEEPALQLRGMYTYEALNNLRNITEYNFIPEDSIIQAYSLNRYRNQMDLQEWEMKYYIENDTVLHIIHSGKEYKGIIRHLFGGDIYFLVGGWDESVFKKRDSR